MAIKGLEFLKKIVCSNCGNFLDKHCTLHLMPCCPGKCKGANKNERFSE